MRENKGVYVTKRDINKYHREYQLNNTTVIPDGEYSMDRVRYDPYTQDVGCQYDCKRDKIRPINRNVQIRRQEIRYFSGMPKQIYAYHGLRSYNDVGVGSVKTVQRKKVKRVYLPETDDRGVGSSKLSSFFINRRTRQNKGVSYYDHKKTSSKCVGGVVEYNTGCVTSAKLSPIVHTRCGATSPAVSIINYEKNVEIGSNTVENNLITITTQVDDEYVRKVYEDMEDSTPAKISEQFAKKKKSEEIIRFVIEDHKSRNTGCIREPEKAFSSDSLVQHVHNLEIPSDDKSHMFIDTMENKLEREYRKMFSISSKESKPSGEKPIPDFKSTSMLRRRFEALRRGAVNTEDSKDNPIVETTLSHTSVISCKDVSIASDPPSLEGRSYSHTKTYSPFQSNTEYNKYIYNPSTSYKKSFTGRVGQDCEQWSGMKVYDDDPEKVKCMFKLWGKKFDLEDNYYDHDDKSTPQPSYDIPKIIDQQPETITAKPKPETQEKKEGKKFFFFKRKSKDKDKDKQPYKSKKGVTAGRCEVGDGLMIKIGAAGTYNTEKIKEPEIVSSEYEEILQKAWLTKYLSHKFDSRNSVHVRWNNKTYATSSSTVFELMDDVYRETGDVFKSKSEITTGGSYYKSHNRHRVNFMQNIEAWMIPKIINNRPEGLPNNYDSKGDIEVTISDQKWFIDKSKAFSHNIEVVLHSNNVVKMNKKSSSEYLRIDIPKGFFVDSCSEEDHPNQSSIEEVYKIVEYESTLDLKKLRKIGQKLDKGDQVSKLSNDIKVTISVKDKNDIESKILETVIKTPPVHRDVVIQGSNVYIPKRCNVIGVGIITQRDLKIVTKSVSKTPDDDLSDEESDRIMQTTPMNRKFAESYLQDYYRNWTPLGIDLFSWCVSDSHLRCCSENSRTSFNYQEDGTKSCPNIYDDFYTSAVFTTSTSSCCHYNTYEEEQPDKVFTTKCDNNFKNTSKENPDKRCLPKDSLEVFRRRLIYAKSNKGNWGTCCNDKPYSVPSIEDKCAQKDTSGDGSKIKKSCCKLVDPKQKKSKCKKHVSLLSSETMCKSAKQNSGKPEGILTFKSSSGCDACKKLLEGAKCPKHATIVPKACQIPISSCMSKKKSPKTFCPKASSCNIPAPSSRTPPLEICGARSPSVSSTSSKPCGSLPSSPSATCSTSSLPQTPPCSKTSQTRKITLPHRPKPSHNKSCSPPCPPNECPTLQCPPQPCPSTPSTKNKKRKAKKKSTCNSTPPPQCPFPSQLLCPQCKSSNDIFPLPSKQMSGPSSSLSSKQKQCICSDSSKSIYDPKIVPAVSKLSSQSVAENNNCDPDCANKKNISEPPHNPATQNDSAEKGKVSGLFLKIKAKKKSECNTEACLSALQGDDIQLNSMENLNIKIKKETPSTEEIRGGLDIKVQDFDGKTLYERRNYKQGGCGHKATVLGDVYKDSNVHRMSAPIAVKNVTSEKPGHEEDIEREEVMERKSDASVTNLVEIQFELRVTQGDKTTEINIDNDKVEEFEKRNTPCQYNNSIQGIYVQNEGVRSGETINPNNDINIRIVIKNFKNNKTKNSGKCDETFSNKISEKFHTVSTGYSNVLCQNTDNVYSIRQTALDLTSSIDKSRNKASVEVMAEELTECEPINRMVSSHSAKFDTDQMEITDEDNAEKSITSKNAISSSGQMKENELSELSRSRYDYEYDNLNKTDSTDQDVTLDLDSSKENNNENISKIIKQNTMIEKKEQLKKLFQKVHDTKPNNTKKIKKLKEMLKHILTSDSSGHEDIENITSNELSKDVTYASLKSNYFRDTESMNNYFKNGSTALSSNVDGKIGSSKFTYPTKENSSSFCSSNSTNASMENIDLTRRCVCSGMAARLNLSEIIGGRGCCCRPNPKKNVETNCDLRNDEDIYVLNYETADYADVETQNSNYLTSKMISANVSMHDNTQLNKMKHVAVNVVELIETQDKTTMAKMICMHKCHKKECEIKKLNRNTKLNISDEDKIVVLEQKNISQEQIKAKDEKETIEKMKEKKRNARIVQGADILQSNETKKAVLEIYAQKTILDGTEHIVAKLPKFTYERESDIRRNYEEIAENGYTSICKRNIVSMFINR